MLDLRIGLLLGLRQIRHASLWTTTLIITVVVFTFLNLVAVSGILTGIVEGALKSTKDEAVSDVAFEPHEGEKRILHTDQLLKELRGISAVAGVSARYTDIATLEANYKERRDLNAEPDTITTTITGIDIADENTVTSLSSIIGEGEYFDPNESGYIILGKYTIDRYADKFGDAFQYLDGVKPGDTIRVTTGSEAQEFTIKGIIDSKIDIVSLKVFLPEREFRRLFERPDFNANSVLVRAKEGYTDTELKNILVENGFESYGDISTFTEGMPSFIQDVITTFDILGAFVGLIGITVASITVFIVIFINALSRKRQIGILKAIGISERAIEYAYLSQAAFYAIIGATLGVLITVFLLVPYFRENPIDFPYGDTSLSVSVEGVALRCLLLFVIMIVAGYFPAWLITRQNTLNSILGRK